MSETRQRPGPGKKYGVTDVYKVRLITHMQIMNHRGLVQVGEFGHVACLVKLCRIDLVYRVRVNLSLLDHDSAFSSCHPLGPSNVLPSHRHIGSSNVPRQAPPLPNL